MDFRDVGTHFDIEILQTKFFDDIGSIVSPAPELQSLKGHLKSTACVQSCPLWREDDGAFAFSENRGRETLLSALIVLNFQQTLSFLSLSLTRQSFPIDFKGGRNLTIVCRGSSEGLPSDATPSYAVLKSLVRTKLPLGSAYLGVNTAFNYF